MICLPLLPQYMRPSVPSSLSLCMYLVSPPVCLHVRLHQPCLIRSIEASPTIIIVPYLVCLPSSVGWSQRHSLHCVVSWGSWWLLLSVRKEPLRWGLVPVHMWLPSGLCCGCSGTLYMWLWRAACCGAL